MSSDHWQRVKQTMETVMSLEGVARRNYYKHLKRFEPKLAKEVKDLIESSEAAAESSFLGSPAVPHEVRNRDDSDQGSISE